MRILYKNGFSFHKRKMKIRKFFLFGVLIFIYFSPANSQAINLARMEAQAKHYFQNQDYHSALPLYYKLDSLKPGNPSYIFPLGVCLLNTSYDAEEALKYFEKCLEEPQKYHWSLNFYAGKAYHLAHKMDEAIHQFNIYKEFLLKDQKKNKETILKIEKEIEMCQNGKELMATPLNLDIVNMGPVINSPYPDYAPVISADQKELIFTSCRPNTTGGGKDLSDGRYYEDIYISYYSDSTGWTAPKNMGDSVNTSGNDASVALSADGQELIIFRNDPNPLSFTTGDLFVSDLRGKYWGKANVLPNGINSSAYEASASISPDGKKLFFSSNRPGGYGGTDIYMAKKLPTGEWAIPVNLGSKINTPYDEDGPFIHSDGKTIYFSSKGHKTMGGFDIFRSTYDEETLEWSKPENIDYPLNTAHDDVHFTWSADGRKVFFSSIRKDGYGDQDIYYAIIHKEESTEVLVMKGYVTDSLSSTPIGAKIIVLDKNNDHVVGIFTSNQATGKFLIILNEGHYKLRIEAENHEPCEKTLDIIELNGFEMVEKNITLCPASIRH
jgi:tetratricopeptide (TPR) repeat protein